MMDLIQTRKQNFIRWKMNVKKLSRKSEQSMVGELKQRMDVPLEVSFVSLLIQTEKNPYRLWHHWEQ